MRLSIVGPVYPYRGGIAHFTSLLAMEAAELGNETQVISFRRQYPAMLYPGKTDKDPSQNPLRVPAEYLLDPLYPWTWRRAVAAISSFRPDVLLIQWWTTFWAPAFAGLSAGLVRQGMPVIYLVHNVLPHESRPWDRELARFALGKSTGQIALSSGEAGRLHDLLPDARVRVAMHPVYDFFPDEGLSTARARERLGLPQEGPILLFFGIVRPYKGLRYLIEALGILHGSGLDAHLLIAGEFWEPLEGYQGLIDNLGLAEYVHIHNAYILNEEVSLYFKAADVFVAPYVSGTQSGAVKTAIGFGLPVVMTSVIAEDEMRHRPFGISVVNPKEPGGLAHAIEAILGRAPETSDETEMRPSDPGLDCSWKNVLDMVRSLCVAHEEVTP